MVSKEEKKMNSKEALKRLYYDAISLNEIEEDVEQIKNDYDLIKQDLDRLKKLKKMKGKVLFTYD